MDASADAPRPRADDLLCFLVHSTGAAFQRAYRKPLERMGLTYPQYLVMLTLWADDALTVGQIGDRLRLDSNTLTPLLKRLEAAGYVTRARSTEDERRVVVRLTPEGRRMQDGAAAVIGCVGEMTGLGEGDLGRLMAGIRALRDNLDAAADAASR